MKQETKPMTEFNQKIYDAIMFSSPKKKSTETNLKSVGTYYQLKLNF